MYLCYQWRSQRGSRGRCPPLGLDSDKIIVVSVFHTTPQITFLYEKRSVATGRAYNSPRPPSRLGRGHPSLDSTTLGAGALTLAPSALGSAPYT